MIWFLLVLEGGCTGARPETDTLDTRPAETSDTGDTSLPPRDDDADGFDVDVDCDDGNPGINPDGVEVCDERDNDCDGLVDDADPSLAATTATEWHPDADGDGFGDSAIATLACVAPPSLIADRSDCRDDDPAIHPGADEACDAVDENCDGQIDEVCTPSPIGVHPLDEYGLRFVGGGARWIAGVGDANGDGTDDVLVGGLFTIDGAKNCGAAWLVPGASSASLALDADNAILVGSDEQQRVGNDAAAAGDLDGDGRNDLLIGSYRGLKAAVVYGPPSISRRFEDADAVLTAGGSLGNGEQGMSGLGDVTSDGLADVALGDLRDTDGAVHLYAGPLAGTVDATAAFATIEGTYYSYFGFGVYGVGDLDADGLPDLVTTSQPGGYGTTDMTVFYGPFSGTAYDRDLADATIDPSSGGTFAAVAAMWGPTLSSDEMDADGDGGVDLFLGGAEGTLGSGGVFLFTGALASTQTVRAATTTLVGEAYGDGAGIGAWAGDLNRDGAADIAVSAYLADTGAEDAGAVYILYGPIPSGTVSLADADAKLLGLERHANAGLGLAAGGELTGDAYPDLVLTAYAETLGGTVDGVAWIIPGGP